MKRWLNVHAGDLRETVRIEKQVITKDAYGADAVTWELFVEERAMIEAGIFRGTEAFVYGQRITQADNPTSVMIRFRTDVSVRDRVVWGARVLNIETMRDPESGRRRWLELICTEVQQ